MYSAEDRLVGQAGQTVAGVDASEESPGSAEQGAG
jgi:hypothetical protein